ncbi:hypothetical protein ONE63_001004 [Megalurothrips usitatus]|uniref:Uncharacterized protein n=1 Tax=Megalurothrips usitatus TaxID=439358 RepID=A0AAV7XAS1_9NEOP|nr:hypothetical protein ONE63_001004 [Megalurothrips usitatus]
MIVLWSILSNSVLHSVILTIIKAPIQLGNQDIQSEGERDDPEEFVEPHGDPINPIQLGESSESQVDDPIELNTWSAMGESTWDEGPSTSGHGADMSDPGGGGSPGGGVVPDGPSCNGPSEKRKARYQRLKRQRLRKEGKEVLSEAKKMKKRVRAKAMKKLKRQKEREASQNYSKCYHFEPTSILRGRLEGIPLGCTSDVMDAARMASGSNGYAGRAGDTLRMARGCRGLDVLRMHIGCASDGADGTRMASGPHG